MGTDRETESEREKGEERHRETDIQKERQKTRHTWIERQ